MWRTAWNVTVAGSTWAADSPATMTIVGTGSANAIPDMATIRVGVTTDARTAADALSENSATTGEVLTLLSEIGIEQEDMQTSNLSLSPLWNDRSSSGSYKQKVEGYRVDNTITLRVRALGDLGVILDDVVASGANQFHGLSFGLQEPQPVQDQARMAAIADAVRKAELYAEAAGVTLGSILSIREGGAGPDFGPQVAQFAARSAVPVAAGELEISAQVTLVYAISDG